MRGGGVGGGGGATCWGPRAAPGGMGPMEMAGEPGTWAQSLSLE